MDGKFRGVADTRKIPGERHWRRGGRGCFPVTEIGLDHSLGRSRGFRLAECQTTVLESDDVAG
jgi:hypothetical protein